MHLFTVLRGNIRKSKGVFISIFLLMFFVSVCVATIFSVYINSRNRDEQVMDETGVGDWLVALNSRYSLDDAAISDHEIASSIRDCEVVSRVDEIPVVYLNVFSKDGEVSGNSIYVIPQDNKLLSYRHYDKTGNSLGDITLNKGEISIPVCFANMYGFEIGDEIGFGVYESVEPLYTFRVVSYIEDPYMGSSLMGVKTCFIAYEDYNTITDMSKPTHVGGATMLNIFKKDKDMKAVEFERTINRETGCSGYSWLSLSRTQASKYMLMLVNIFSGILMVFVVLLLVISLIVLGHNINSSIEQDYVNLGILKAVGMTSRDIRGAILIGNICAAALGLIAGLPVSVPCIKFINTITSQALGLFVKSTVQLKYIVPVDLIMLIIIALFIIIKTAKVAQISPVTAMNSGRNKVYCSKLFTLPVSKRFLAVSLAVRQFVSGIRQYASAIVVTMLLTVFMVMIGNTVEWANDSESVRCVFMPYEIDMYIGTDDENVRAEAEELVAAYSDYDRFFAMSKYMLFDDVQIQCSIIDSPEYVSSILEGRTCENDNEVLITPYVKEQFDLDVGDTVRVSTNGIEKECLITGIMQNANDTGNNFCMNFDNYSTFVDDAISKEDITEYAYNIHDNKKLPDIKEAITTKYGDNEQIFVQVNDGSNSGLDIIVLAINGLAALVYAMAGIFVIITVILVCSKIYSREKIDYGIYKAIGFKSSNIRVQLSLRFVVAALIGSVLGIIVACMVSDIFIGSIFKTFGVYNFESDMTLIAAILPVIFMAAVFFVFSFAVSGKVKRVEPRVLITE